MNKLHKVACEILKCPDTGNNSHTWHWSAATNLANTGLSFINLKRHGQWITDSVVEGYIANSRPLKNCLHCLIPRKESKEILGQHQDLICTKNQHIELEEMVDLSDSNPPQENVDPKDRGQTLLGFSQNS